MSYSSIFLHLFALVGIGCSVGFLVMLLLFGPRIYRYLRKEYAGGWPFDYPSWYYRLRKWYRLNRDAVRATLGDTLFLIGLLIALWIGLVITCQP